MFKAFKKIDKLHILLALCFVFIFSVAAVPDGITRFTSLIIGSASDTPDVTPGDDDLYVKGTSEFDGAMRVDGAITATGGMTLTSTGGITGTNIADVTRSFALELGAGGVDGGYDLDESSTPDLSTCDGIPCLVWAASNETTAVGWTFRLPSDFVSTLVVYALISSNAASGAGQKLDWAVFENIDGTAFDATPIPQAAVESTEAALNTKNDVLTLTSDATAETAYTAGDWITLEFFNASTDDDDLELKGLTVTYTATQ